MNRFDVFTKRKQSISILNSETFKNNRRRKSELSLVHSMFHTVGINICKINSNIKLVCLSQALIIFSFAIFVEGVAAEIYKLYLRDTDCDIKSYMSSGFSLLLCLFQWFKLNHSKGDLCEALDEMLVTAEALNISLNTKVVKTAIFVPAITYTFYCCGTYYFQSGEETAGAFELITFKLLEYDEDRAKSLYLLHTIFLLYAYLYFPMCFAVFYVLLCIYMKKMLMEHIKLNKYIRVLNEDPYTLRISCFRRYDEILLRLQKLNELLSWPVYSYILNNAIVLLIAIIYIKNGYTKFYSVFLPVFSIVSMTVVFFAASGVNDADKTAKESNLRVLRISSPEEETPVFEKTLAFYESSKNPAFAMSAGGFFEFTRGLYLTAAGCLLTYTLLITQI